jgi:hypothetical protein
MELLSNLSPMLIHSEQREEALEIRSAGLDAVHPQEVAWAEAVVEWEEVPHKDLQHLWHSQLPQAQEPPL